MVDYGRGSNPILPLDLNCNSYDNVFTDCTMSNFDAGQCLRVAGVDCGG